MRMTLLELSEKIKKAIGRDFFDEDVCNDIIDLGIEVGSVSYDYGNFYVEFDVISYDCDDLTSDNNIIEIKEVQTPGKVEIIDKEINGWGRVTISHIPELDWYELVLNDEPLQYFESFKEAKGDIPL